MYRPVMNTKEFNMNFIEKQTELGKSLYEINTSAMSNFAELSRKNIEQYFEVNRSFGEKLPEVKEVIAEEL